MAVLQTATSQQLARKFKKTNKFILEIAKKYALKIYFKGDKISKI